MNRSAYALALVALVLSSLCAPLAHADGWFKKATGVKTPKIIRDIAPKGISVSRARQGESTFGDPVYLGTEISLEDRFNRLLHFRVSYLPTKGARQTFTDKKLAIPTRPVTFRTPDTVKKSGTRWQIEVVATDPDSGRQVGKWTRLYCSASTKYYGRDYRTKLTARLVP